MNSASLKSVIAAFAFSTMAGQTQAQTPPSPPQITVTGEGEHAMPPDMATITMAVVREADTARAAMAASSQAMREVLGALRGAGIAERDVQTSGLNIQPRYAQQVPPRPGQPYVELAPKIAGYSVSNQVTVRIRRIADAGDILDKVVALGVNQGGNIAFSVDDPKPALSEARRRAVADAIDKAMVLAEAAGVKLGRVSSMQEGSSRTHPMPMQARAFDSMAKGAPIAAGESTYQSHVTMTFEIERP